MRNVLSGPRLYDHATDAQEPYSLARTHHRTGGGEGKRGKETKRQTERSLIVFVLCVPTNPREITTARQEIIVRYIRHLLNSTVLGDLRNQTQGHF